MGAIAGLVAATSQRYARLRLWLPVLLWMGAIFTVSSRPSVPSLSDALLDLLVKKGAHFGAYLILGMLVARALSAGIGPGARERLAGWVLCIAYAVSDEIHQSLVPGRHAGLVDVLIDAAGALAGIWAFARWPARLRVFTGSMLAMSAAADSSPAGQFRGAINAEQLSKQGSVSPAFGERAAGGGQQRNAIG